jgi:hypothetical protein
MLPLSKIHPYQGNIVNLNWIYSNILAFKNFDMLNIDNINFAIT